MHVEHLNRTHSETLPLILPIVFNPHSEIRYSDLETSCARRLKRDVDAAKNLIGYRIGCGQTRIPQLQF